MLNFVSNPAAPALLTKEMAMYTGKAIMKSLVRKKSKLYRKQRLPY